MAVNRSSPQLRTYLVKLVAEFRHLVCGVFITGDDLVDRVNDNCFVMPVLGPSDQLWSQLIHGQAPSPEVPYINVTNAVWACSQGIVDIPEAVQT